MSDAAQHDVEGGRQPAGLQTWFQRVYRRYQKPIELIMCYMPFLLYMLFVFRLYCS